MDTSLSGFGIVVGVNVKTALEKIIHQLFNHENLWVCCGRGIYHYYIAHSNPVGLFLPPPPMFL